MLKTLTEHVIGCCHRKILQNKCRKTNRLAKLRDVKSTSCAMSMILGSKSRNRNRDHIRTFSVNAFDFFLILLIGVGLMIGCFCLFVKKHLNILTHSINKGVGADFSFFAKKYTIRKYLFIMYTYINLGNECLSFENIIKLLCLSKRYTNQISYRLTMTENVKFVRIESNRAIKRRWDFLTWLLICHVCIVIAQIFWYDLWTPDADLFF